MTSASLFPKTWKALAVFFDPVPSAFISYFRCLLMNVLKCNISPHHQLGYELKGYHLCLTTKPNNIQCCGALWIKFLTLSPKQCITVFCILLKCNMDFVVMEN